MGKSKRVRTLIKHAKRGNPYTMYELGLCYQLGRGVKQDLQRAAEWMFAAADEGYAPAVEWAKDYAFDDDAFVQGNA